MAFEILYYTQSEHHQDQKKKRRNTMRPRKGWRDLPNTPAHVSQRSQERGIGHRRNMEGKLIQTPKTRWENITLCIQRA